MIILRGHHHKDWYYAIKQIYQKRTQPPVSEREKTPQDKSPLELCVAPVREMWQFFEKIWESKNDCLHNPSDDPLYCFDAQLNKHLIHYKQTGQPC